MTERKIPHVKDIFRGGGKGEKFKYSDYDDSVKKEDIETTEVIDAKVHQTLSHPEFDVTEKNPEYKKKSFAQLADRKLLGIHGKGPAPQAPSQYGNYEKQHKDYDIGGSSVEGILPGIQRMPPTDLNHNERDGDSDYDEGYPSVNGNGFDVNGFMNSMSSSSKYNPIFEDKQTRESEHNRVNQNIPAFMTIFTKPEKDDDTEPPFENVTTSDNVYKEEEYDLSERDKENLPGGIDTDDTPVAPPRKSKMGRNKAPEKDDYTVEEQVMEFSSESDDENKKANTNIYHQYDGEDFGQFIDSDEEEDSGIGDEGTTRRRIITQPHMKQKPAKPLLGPKQSSRGGIALKKKLDKSLSGAHKPKRYGSSLHNYSYADTKIGTEDVYGKKMTLLRNKGRPEDDRENTKLWWSYDMLSAQTSDNNVEVLYKSQRKNNAGELLAEIAGDKKSKGKAPVPSMNRNDNFESLRKEIQYDAPLIPKKESPLKKLTGSIRARTSQEVNVYANAAANPIYYDIQDKKNSHF